VADLVLDLNDRRPIWAIPPWAVEAIRERLPPSWSLHAVRAPADGSGDGRGTGPAPEVLEAVRGAQVYVGYGVPPEVLAVGADTLRWVHTGTAGVGGSLHPAMQAAGIPFTNSAGVHGPPIAESVVGMILHFLRGFHLAAPATGEGRWDPSPFLEADAPLRELSSTTVGILGMGGIGREVAWRVGALGAEVVGLRRPVSPKVGAGRDASGVDAGGGRPGPSRVGPDMDRWRPSLVNRPIPGRPDVANAREGPEACWEPETREAQLARVTWVETFPALLRRSQVLVVCAPETSETRGLVNAAALAQLPSGSLLVNVSRGALVVEPDLVDALRAGRLVGAALDVFATEPLPADSPLWTLPNVLVTPHVSGVSREFWKRQVHLVTENLARLQDGRPLLNLVDMERGY
jgi:phosphoglycerate dehydrogenase-like enzyme